jgi:aryl-alcohol dehydrogenase-like predicted oxidoreductase
LNRIALGTAQFGLDYGIANNVGRVSDREFRNILTSARLNGIDLLDTAVAYGDSEQRLGEIGVAEWHVVSKLPAVPARCKDIPAWVSTSVRVSLRGLKVSSLYGLLLHRPRQLLEPYGDELYQALLQLKHEGLTHKIGVSVYHPSELDAVCARFPVDLVQAPLNLLDRRLVYSGWLERLTRRNTELHVRSVFLQGLLLMDASIRPKQFARWQPLWSALDRWLIETQLTPLQACVRYALSFVEISKVVVGVDSEAQLEAIRSCGAGPLPQIPHELTTDDTNLLNPSRWALN